MEKEIIQGTTPGQRRRRRPKTYWHNNIMKWTGLSGDSLLRSVEDRTQWQKIVHVLGSRKTEQRTTLLQLDEKVLPYAIRAHI